MRHALLILPLIVPGHTVAQAPPACGQAALEATQESWSESAALSADFTLDGKTDIAFWKREEAMVLLYIAACDGERAVETWRFGIPVSGPATDDPPVAVVSPIMDATLVNRVCGHGESDECTHMRRENQRRQAIADAGGRELRIGAPAATGVRLRWSAEAGGFLRIGGQAP